MTAAYIGIDPGLSGGLAFLCGEHVEATKMPPTDADLFYELECAKAAGARVACIEKVGATPQMGVVSAFKFGQSVGSIRMACIAAGLRVEYVTPQKWQRELGLIVSGRGLGQGDTAKKNRNKARAQELFPGVKLTHATADALLIAEYARRMDRVTEAGREDGA